MIVKDHGIWGSRRVPPLSKLLAPWKAELVSAEEDLGGGILARVQRLEELKGRVRARNRELRLSWYSLNLKPKKGILHHCELL